MKAERAALEAQRRAEAGESRKALAEIDFLQARRPPGCCFLSQSREGASMERKEVATAYTCTASAQMDIWWCSLGALPLPVQQPLVLLGECPTRRDWLWCCEERKNASSPVPQAQLASLQTPGT